jgi:hypothetical protein
MTYTKDLEDSDLRKARMSLREELDAIDSYEKRIESGENVELKKILMNLTLETIIKNTEIRYNRFIFTGLSF